MLTAEGEAFGPFEDKREALAVLHPRAALWSFALFWIGVLAMVVLLSMSAFGQTPSTTSASPVWSTVTDGTNQRQNVILSVPAGTVYRFGDAMNNKWTAPVTAASAITIPNYDDGTLGTPPDPDPGVWKVFQVAETASPQAITITDNGVSPAAVVIFSVPALPPSPVSFTPGTVYPVVISKLAPTAGSLAQVLLQRIPVSANVVIGGVLSGFSFNITVNGVTLECLYGSADVAGNVTLSCIVPTAPPTQ